MNTRYSSSTNFKTLNEINMAVSCFQKFEVGSIFEDQETDERITFKWIFKEYGGSSSMDSDG
jgi:hypothetical protein